MYMIDMQDWVYGLEVRVVVCTRRRLGSELNRHGHTHFANFLCLPAYEQLRSRVHMAMAAGR